MDDSRNDGLTAEEGLTMLYASTPTPIQRKALTHTMDGMTYEWRTVETPGPVLALVLKRREASCPDIEMEHRDETMAREWADLQEEENSTWVTRIERREVGPWTEVKR